MTVFGVTRRAHPPRFNLSSYVEERKKTTLALLGDRDTEATAIIRTHRAASTNGPSTR